MFLISPRLLWLFIKSFFTSLLEIIKIIKLKITIKICKTIEKFPKYEFRNAKAIIIIVDLNNTWYLKTAIIESE